MATYEHTARRFWGTLLVLTQVLAMILPATTKSVSAQAPLCAGITLQTASLAESELPAADEQVTIDKDAVDAAAIEALWQYRYTDAEKLYEAFVESIILNSDDTLDVAKFLQTFHKNFESAIPPADLNRQDLYPYDDILHTMFHVALNMPEVARVVPTVWQEMSEFHTPGSITALWFGDSAWKISASTHRYSLAVSVVQNAAIIFAQARDCAKQNPELAGAIGEFFGEGLNAGILDDAKKIIEGNPDLPFPTEISGRINADGTLTISLDELKALSEAEFEKVHASIDDIQETLVEIDKQQDVIVDYIKDQELKAKHQELAKKKAAEHQLKLDAAKASVSILSTIMGQIDPKLGKQVSTIGTSTIQVGEALNNWLKGVSGLKGLASLSTVVMTGNVLTAVMNVVSLFGETQPTPEQMILEEIGKLRQQVNQLRQEMHSRFDRIDRVLNAIYTTMQQRFDLIDLQLGKINGNVLEVQQSLVALDMSLSRIERNNFEFLNALSRRPLLDAVNGGLGYAERTGIPMPYQPDFIAFENTFHGWGTIHAFDPVNAGPTQRDYSDAQILAELNAYPLDSNINYLNGWLFAHGLPPLSGKPLASPRDWLFASRAYSQLGLEWPEHMRRVDLQRQARLDEIGLDLEKAMQNISTVQTQAGPIANTLLFSTVITLYQGKLNAMDSSIQVLESRYITEVFSVDLKRDEPFDLYGGIAQDLFYETSELTTFTCGAPETHGSFAATSNLRSLFPNLERYNLADYLRLGRIDVCVKNELVGQHEECLSAAASEPQFCIKYGFNKASITVYFNSVSIMSQSITEENRELANQWDPDMTPNWIGGRNYKARFEVLNSVDPASSGLAAQRVELLATVTSQLEKTLYDFQQELYKQILDEVTVGSLRSLATEIAGSKALLDSFVILGFPRAIVEDEFLHAMLFGNQQLIEDTQIAQTYAISATQPITETNLLVNPRPGLRQVADERLAAFSELLKGYLDGISAQAHFEQADFIASTRSELDLTMRIARIEVPSPGEQAIGGLQASSDSPTPLGNATRFVASVTAGTNISYAWNFGDGTVGSGANPTHIYGESGVYNVLVTASNSISQATTEMQVVVEPTDANQTTQQIFLPSLNR